MAYEISKTLHYTKHVVETPLGEAEVSLPDDQLVIATILRAGDSVSSGFSELFRRCAERVRVGLPEV